MANILLLSLVFPPDSNSNAFIFSDLALELKKHGHVVRVITTTPHYSVLAENLLNQPLNNGKSKWYKESSFQGIKCYHIVVSPKKGNMLQRAKTYLKFHLFSLVLGFSKRIKFDIVLTQSPPLSIGIISAIIAKRRKAKSIYIVQDLFPDGQIIQKKIKNPILIKSLRFIEKQVYKSNDAIVAISKGIENNLRLRVPSKTLLRYIPNFVDTEIYYPRPKKNYLCDKYNLNNKFVISYVGNIGNAHDLSSILYAASKLKHLPIEFIIAGDGIKRSFFEKQAIAEKLHNVKFIGYQKRELTPLINAISDICLVLLAPHIRTFSFPSKTYTLMAMKKPIIVMCSGECDIAEFVKNAKCGWHIENGHYEDFSKLIVDLYSNSDLLKQYSTNSLRIVEKNFTKEVVGNQYNNLIKDLLNA